MTNREKLFQELTAMDDARLGALLETMEAGSTVISNHTCRDCPNHVGDDFGCRLTVDGDIPEGLDCPSAADWLSWPCKHDRLLP